MYNYTKTRLRILQRNVFAIQEIRIIQNPKLINYYFR